ncbi:MAG TPA: exo-alpha-sialidase [Thermoproteales archaeon]|nr:exo-alpha-sialidase [Thermoproteales archaeon]
MKLKVYKEVFVPEDPRGGIVNGDISYTSRSGLKLVHSYGIALRSDTYDYFYERFSADNGRTWSKPRLAFKDKEVENGFIRYSGITYFLDEEEDKLLRFYGEGFYPKDDPKLARWEVYYQVYGRDGWGKPLSVSEVVLGGRKGVLMISCSFPIKTSKGKIIVPCQLKAVRNGKIWFPFPNYFSPFYESAVLIGEWSRGVVKWELSEIITIDPNISCRLCEPTVVELKDGRLSMVMRGDNGAFPEKPGYKWYSVSEDGGYTWTKPKPLKYTNGKPIFSPSSCSLLFRSWKTGKIYWIANILDKNPVGNRPRYPLQIVEIDEEKLAVKKETMLVIDDRKRGDSPLVQFSNFRYYQDRVTGDLVILMARYGEKSGKENILRSPLYRYVIELD